MRLILGRFNHSNCLWPLSSITAAVVGQTKGPLSTSSHQTAVSRRSLGKAWESWTSECNALPLCEPNPRYLATTQSFLQVERKAAQEPCACRHACTTVRTSNRRGAAASEVCVPRRWPLGRLGSRGSCWAERAPEPN